MVDKMKMPTFLKWAGGKRRVINKIEPFLPKKMERYFEAFLGAGSMFFYIKQKYNPYFSMLSDINLDLIETFKMVRDEPKKLIRHLKYFKKNNSEKFYYETRDKFNEKELKGIKRNAAFIYLNKTCFNGLWRVNSKNKFNVPCGKYKNPEIFNEDTLFLASGLLQGVIIKQMDYGEILKYVKERDFVYLDPCYDPIKKTSFANYNPKRFSEEDRIELSKFIFSLKRNKVNFALSNNNLKEIREIYKNFKIEKILALRSINSNGLGRGNVVELLIH